MTVLDIIVLVAGALGVAFGVRCYVELYRWARQCQGARIAIAMNRRVQLQAPLVEWLNWTNALEGDERSTGRVVYRNGKVTVAILKPADPDHGHPLRRVVHRAKHARARARSSRAPARAA